MKRIGKAKNNDQIIIDLKQKLLRVKTKIAAETSRTRKHKTDLYIPISHYREVNPKFKKYLSQPPFESKPISQEVKNTRKKLNKKKK